MVKTLDCKVAVRPQIEWLLPVYFSIFFAVLSLPNRSEAQWLNGYVGATNDIIQDTTWIEHPTFGKAIAFAGMTNSLTPDWDFQAWVALVDPAGQFIWSRMYGTEQSTMANSIAPVIDSTGTPSNLVIAGRRGQYAWLAEMKSDTGEPGWQCEYQTLGAANSVTPTQDGGSLLSKTAFQLSHES